MSTLRIYRKKQGAWYYRAVVDAQLYYGGPYLNRNEALYCAGNALPTDYMLTHWYMRGIA